MICPSYLYIVDAQEILMFLPSLCAWEAMGHAHWRHQKTVAKVSENDAYIPVSYETNISLREGNFFISRDMTIIVNILFYCL